MIGPLSLMQVEDLIATLRAAHGIMAADVPGAACFLSLDGPVIEASIMRSPPAEPITVLRRRDPAPPPH